MEGSLDSSAFTTSSSVAWHSKHRTSHLAISEGTIELLWGGEPVLSQHQVGMIEVPANTKSASGMISAYPCPGCKTLCSVRTRLVTVIIG
jgi:hypothetical protein